KPGRTSRPSAWNGNHACGAKTTMGRCRAARKARSRTNSPALGNAGLGNRLEYTSIVAGFILGLRSVGSTPSRQFCGAARKALAARASATADSAMGSATRLIRSCLRSPRQAHVLRRQAVRGADVRQVDDDVVGGDDA